VRMDGQATLLVGGCSGSRRRGSGKRGVLASVSDGPLGRMGRGACRIERLSVRRSETVCIRLGQSRLWSRGSPPFPSKLVLVTSVRLMHAVLSLTRRVGEGSAVLIVLERDRNGRRGWGGGHGVGRGIKDRKEVRAQFGDAGTRVDAKGLSLMRVKVL
jgi:hypothetical protein